VGLATRKILHGAPKFEVAVIGPDLKRIVKSGQELMPILKSLGDRKHLTIPDLVVALGFFKERRSEGNWMLKRVYVNTLLQDYSASGVS
jgi:hypothetical protein